MINLPYSEDLARGVVAALQDILFTKEFDPKTVELGKVIADPNSSFGIRIYAITGGPGNHVAQKGLHGARINVEEYSVPAGEIYATIDTTTISSGSCTTYIFSREANQNLRLRSSCLHSRY